MIALRFSEAAAVSMVEQSDYYLEPPMLHWLNSGKSPWIISVELSRTRRRPLLSFVCLSWNALDLCSRLSETHDFYQYLPEESTLRIVQVLHGARDL